MTLLFISDLHLSPDHPELTDCFIRFLGNYTQNIQALYILGDFFDYWVGDDQIKSNDYITPVIHALKKYPAPIYMMHGNRDFLLGAEFAKQANITLLPDPVKIKLYNNNNEQAVLLTHGDLLCTQDKNYQKWRKIVRKSWVQKIFLLLPLSWREKIASKIRKNSTGYYSNFNDKPDKNRHGHEYEYGNGNGNGNRNGNREKNSDIDTDTAQLWRNKYHVKQIIHGHTHQPAIYSDRLVLPAWHDGRGGVLIISLDKIPEIVYFY